MSSFLLRRRVFREVTWRRLRAVPNQTRSNDTNMARKSIHVGGVLTEEAKEIADTQFSNAQTASQEMVKRIDDSRRLTDKDMEFRCNTLD
jgi:hypothetical protein